MSMSAGAWSLFAATLLTPFAALAQSTHDGTSPESYSDAASATDIFSGATVLDVNALKSMAGGADVATDIGNLGVNIADTDGSVQDIDASHSNTGEIAHNVVGDNHGITTVFNNTGNGVVFQSNVQINVFLNNGN